MPFIDGLTMKLLEEKGLGQMNKRLIGLDLSLTSTGISWTSGDTILTDKICPEMPNEEMPRYLFILNKIKEKVEEIKPDAIIIEGYSFGSRGRCLTQLAELRGVLKYFFYINNIKWLEIAPKSLKKFTTGNGNADKEAMADAAFWNWEIDLLNWREDNDRCDAYCLIKFFLENQDEESL